MSIQKTKIPTQQMKIEPETHRRFKVASANAGLTFTKFTNNLLERFENDNDVKFLDVPTATREYTNEEKKSLTIEKDAHRRLKVFTVNYDFTLSVGLDKLMKRATIDDKFDSDSTEVVGLDIEETKKTKKGFMGVLDRFNS